MNGLKKEGLNDSPSSICWGVIEMTDLSMKRARRERVRALPSGPKLGREDAVGAGCCERHGNPTQRWSGRSSLLFMVGSALGLWAAITAILLLSGITA